LSDGGNFAGGCPPIGNVTAPDRRKLGCTPIALDAMKIRLVEDFDADFTLDPALKADLVTLLTGPTFIAQIALELQCGSVEFADVLFQPVPYTTATPKGMPAEIEAQYYNQPDYGIINVPPNFMFKAKIFKPSRLCAVYRKCR
jgi:hypothetical protein